jgi:hypothetical protein
MKKLGLIFLIFLDLLLLAASGMYLYWHLTGNAFTAITLPSHGLPMPVSKPVPGIGSTDTMHATTGYGLLNPPVPAGNPAPASSENGVRHIQFVYRNPKARQVSIRADFTGWKAEPMQKDARGIWVYQSALTPGEYAYCYTVDDKTFRDPANKRTKQIGHTFVSSIVVSPLAAKPPH